MVTRGSRRTYIPGADPIAFVDRAGEPLETPPPIVDAFFVRKEPKPHGMQRLVEGIDPTEGRRVVIIDDVCTKGGSTAIAIQERTIRAGMQVLGAICLVESGKWAPVKCYRRRTRLSV